LVLLLAAAAMAMSGCAKNAQLAPSASYGPKPVIPAPSKYIIPQNNTASSASWQGGETPVAPQGLTVKAFAKGLDHPRWLYVLPNGDVLVAESNHGAQWEDTMGYGGWVESLIRRMEGLSTKSANRITLLRDTDGDGVADQRTVFLSGLNGPIGMVLVGDTFYVADTDALLAFPYQTGETQISEPPRKITDLPAGKIDHHWTKNVIASKDGSGLFVTVGSNSNAGENGLSNEMGRAAIWIVNPKTGEHRIYASGLRNPNGLGWSPGGALWTAVNERDELGGDLVPDYMTAVKDGDFYGWPWSYYGQHIDDRVKPGNPAMVAKAIVPDYALGTHTASLGLTFTDGAHLGPEFSSGVLVAQHGSWNRKPVNGYRVVFVPFQGESPSGPPVDFLSGFLTPDGHAHGRPVDVVIDKKGGALVTDDTGNIVWRVSKG
jgi:glucose/arabinose dehydrogenase